MRKTPLAPVIAGVVVLVLVVVAVTVLFARRGGDEGDQAAEQSTLITSIDNMEDAAVQIEARGSYRDFDGSSYQFAGTGSGFIVDPSGIVVTNNHVVAGAGSLQVYVGGSETPVNARILGVSECSDLAVIQLSGSGYPYVNWYQGEIAPPLDVYAAGFPLGDPEFTLTRGIVAKAEVDGDVAWASVERVIEHDANIQPGNSGGPLVTGEAEVVAVNYAGGSPTNTEQFFAIPATIAVPIVERLATGVDLDSIGINGEAVAFDNFAGVWVYGVSAGSPASSAGIRPGDLIVTMGGRDMGEDGTLAPYCDVLRTQGTDRAIAVEVYRDDTGEFLEGEINGRIIEPIGPGDGPGDEPGDEPGGEPGDEPASGDFVEVSDTAGRIFVSVPSNWTDIDVDGSRLDVDFAVAPDLDAFYFSDELNPGLFIVVEPDAGQSDIATVLELFREVGTDCGTAETLDYYDGVYTGEELYYTACPNGNSVSVIVAGPAEEQYLFAAVLVYPGDREDIYDTLVATLFVFG